MRAVRDERKKFKEIPDELRKKHRAHKENFERAREPLLQGLASKSDLKLFKEAQAKACEVLVRASSGTLYYGVILNLCRQTLVIFVINLQLSLGNYFRGNIFFSVNNYTCIKPEKGYYNKYIYRDFVGTCAHLINGF